MDARVPIRFNCGLEDVLWKQCEDMVVFWAWHSERRIIELSQTLKLSFVFREAFQISRGKSPAEQSLETTWSLPSRRRFTWFTYHPVDISRALFGLHLTFLCGAKPRGFSDCLRVTGVGAHGGSDRAYFDTCQGQNHKIESHIIL